MAEFQNGLFGCFGDIGLCIIAYFVPCYQAGKNAETIGKSCMTYGGLYLFIPCITGAIVRQGIREQKGISVRFFFNFLFLIPCWNIFFFVNCSCFDTKKGPFENPKLSSRASQNFYLILIPCYQIQFPFFPEWIN